MNNNDERDYMEEQANEADMRREQESERRAMHEALGMDATTHSQDVIAMARTMIDSEAGPLAHRVARALQAANDAHTGAIRKGKSRATVSQWRETCHLLTETLRRVRRTDISLET